MAKYDCVPSGTFVLAWNSTEPDTEPDSANRGTAKGFIGFRIFSPEVSQNGALMGIFGSRIGRTAAHDTGAANMGVSAGTSCATGTCRAARRSDVNSLVGPCIA